MSHGRQKNNLRFQHTAARRRLEPTLSGVRIHDPFQHTAARRRLGRHERLDDVPVARFNTQPPEGGWFSMPFVGCFQTGFNTQPPEGGWGHMRLRKNFMRVFQHTAARRRLAADLYKPKAFLSFQHTAARRRLGSQRTGKYYPLPVSTHSRPKAAGLCASLRFCAPLIVSTHSRPKAAGTTSPKRMTSLRFQHTAA